MHFLLPDELAQFKETLRAFFRNQKSNELSRKFLADIRTGVRGTAVDAEILRDLTRESGKLGMFLAPLEEAAGGLGFGALALNVIGEELGYGLCPPPLSETVQFGIVRLMCLAEPEKLPDFERIVAGEQPVSGLVKLESGEQLLLEPESAIHFVVSPREQSSELFRLASVSGQPQPTIDLTRTALRIFNCERDKDVAGVIPDRARCEQLEIVFAASELVGLGRRVLDLTLEYVKTRRQFEQPIGSFQAIQQNLAEQYVRLEGAASLTRYAAYAAALPAAEFRQAILAAKGFVAEVVPALCEQCLQVHGGIGFTFEYDLHLYLRRAEFLSRVWGTARSCYEELGNLGIPARS